MYFLTAHAWGYKVVAYNNPYVSMTKPSAADDLGYGTREKLFARMPDGTVGVTGFISGGGFQPARLNTGRPLPNPPTYAPSMRRIDRAASSLPFA